MSRCGSILLKKYFGASNEIYKNCCCVSCVAMRGTTSLLRKTTMELRIGTTGHLRYGIVQKLTFARFFASFDFRLFQHYRSKTEVTQPELHVGSPPQQRTSGDWISMSVSCHEQMWSRQAAQRKYRAMPIPVEHAQSVPTPLGGIELAGCSFGGVLWAGVECDCRARCCLMDGVDHHLEQDQAFWRNP